MRFVLILMTPIALGAGCIVIDGDRVLARHLANAMPAFAGLNSEEPVALSPVAGSERIFSFTELNRLAQRNGITLPAATPPVCVTQKLEPLSRTAVDNAVRDSLRTLGEPETLQLEMLEYSQQVVPAGAPEFPLAALSRPPGGDVRVPVYWRGRLRQPGGRSYSIWVKVRASVRRSRVVAAVDLSPGLPIQASSVRIDSIDEPPSARTPTAGPWVTDPAEVAGRIARRTIRTGEPIHNGMLLARRDVERGERVTVEVRSGAARLALDARAESSGKAGDGIVLRNQATGKRFRGRIDGPGRVTVETEPTTESENTNVPKNTSLGGARLDRLPALGGAQTGAR